MNLARLCTSTATLLALGLSGVSAHAYKLDISGTTSATTDITLDAGTYEISWIGQSGGGLYDAWTYNAATSGNYRDAFTMTLGGTTFTVDKATPTPYANFTTAQDALTAFQTGNYAVYASTTSTSQTPFAALGEVSTVSFTLTAPTLIKFGVPDNLFTDNTGGVSLSLTAVPEPQTVALLLAGLGAVGFVARRRKAD